MRLLSSETGFGTVYEAYERDVPKILKVLRPDRSENPKVVHLFQKEAQVLSQLKHPGVPFVAKDGYFTYLPKGSNTPLHCIVMEKIDGPNLQQWMLQQGNHPIGESQAIQWLTQLTDILRRVHLHNYFHRDIKPDNVMLRANGQLVLVDFGAAREMTQTYLAQVGSLGVTTVSSAGYTPPEQEQGQAVPQSDFYAMGRTIIFLLTGQSPNDTALYDPMFNTFNWRPRALQVSEEFASLLDALIAPRVVDRPKTAQEILDRLHHFPPEVLMSAANAAHHLAETTLPDNDLQISGLPQPPAPSTKPQDQTVLPTEASHITGWTWLIACGVTLAAGGLIGVGFWRQQQATSPPSSSETVSAPAEKSAVPSLPVELLRTFSDHQNSINALALTSGGQEFISVSADRTIRRWHLGSGKLLTLYEGHTTFINAITLSPDEKTLYSGSADGRIYQWNLATGERQTELAGHPGAVNTLDRTPDGQLLVSGASEGTIKLWNTQTGTLVNTLAGHSGAINALVVTNDGQRVISGGTDRTIRLWDIQSGRPIRVLEGHGSYVNAIAISPDGRILFSASADRTIKRWNLDTGEELDTLTEHSSYVNVLAVSRDGQTVSSGSADETVRVWDVKTGELLKIYTGFDMPIYRLLIPSEKQLVTASRENPAVKAWLTDP